MSELTDDDLKPVMDAVRRDARCDVQAVHPVRMMFDAIDIESAIRRLVAWREAQRIADWTNPDEHNHEPLLRMAAEAKRAYFGGE